MQPIIMHLDMNSYFASVEQQDNPAWRGKPVGVCEHLGGIIIAASVEAKKWGIKTGTPVWEAKKLYPKIILTHTRAEAYRFYTRRFLKVVGDYTNKVEKYSIDECFLDISRQCNVKIPKSKNQMSNKIQNPNAKTADFYQADPFEEAVKIARKIKFRFKFEVGDWLRCSVGIADNKALAKIASDMKKPDGLVVIAESRTAKIKMQNSGAFSLTKDELYDYLKLTDIPGIGRRQERNLNQLGIKTLKDLRDFPRSHLVARFGKVMGYHLYNLGQLRGTWKEGVVDDGQIKSMGHMYTLPAEFRRAEFFLPVLYKLCEMVGRRLRRKNLEGNVIVCYFHPHTNSYRSNYLAKVTGEVNLSSFKNDGKKIGVGVNDKDYEGFGDSRKLGIYLQDGREIFLEAVRLLGCALSAPSGTFPAGTKLIGVTVAGLRPYVSQMSLFGDVERQRRLVGALDKINTKYGEFTIMRALQAPSGKVFRDSVGFGRMKEL